MHPSRLVAHEEINKSSGCALVAEHLIGTVTTDVEIAIQAED
jgi:hypothetical protein